MKEHIKVLLLLTVQFTDEQTKLTMNLHFYLPLFRVKTGFPKSNVLKSCKLF